MPPAPCTIGSIISAAICWEFFSRVCLSSATSAEVHDSPNRHFGCSIKNCLVIDLENKVCRVGIIVSEPYMYMTVSYTAWPDQDHCDSMMELDDWCYDIMIGDEIIKMMPEEFLDKIEEE